MRNRAFLLVALVLAGIVGAGIAQASIPAADGTINGCRKNSDGSLKVIDSAATCPNGYTALNWRQVNPTVVSSSVPLTFEAGDINGTNVTCPSGRLATGGGGLLDSASSTPLLLISTWPLILNGVPSGWQAIWRNPTANQITPNVTIYAICTGS